MTTTNRHSRDVRYNFYIETMFGSSLPSVVCRRAHVVFTLFVFVINGVQYILCCVFVLAVFLWCTLCCQFLWIVFEGTPEEDSQNKNNPEKLAA
jgi:hypothetical protein